MLKKLANPIIKKIKNSTAIKFSCYVGNKRKETLLESLTRDRDTIKRKPSTLTRMSAGRLILIHNIVRHLDSRKKEIQDNLDQKNIHSLIKEILDEVHKLENKIVSEKATEISKFLFENEMALDCTDISIANEAAYDPMDIT